MPNSSLRKNSKKEEGNRTSIMGLFFGILLAKMIFRPVFNTRKRENKCISRITRRHDILNIQSSKLDLHTT